MVKCSECGFLSFREKVSWTFVEAIDTIRVGHTIPPTVNPMPFCFARKLDFRTAYGWEPTALGIGDVEIFPAIMQERECDGFTAWHQGFTPKEHQEMLDRQWRLEFEAAERDKERDWREEQRRLDIDWRTDQTLLTKQQHHEEMELLRRQHRWQLGVFGFVVTLAVVVSTIVGAMIQAAWIGKPW